MLNGSKRTASMRTAGVATACVAALLFLGTTVNAQNTFEVITQGAVTNVPGLRAMTVRDNSLSLCYTVFLLESSTGPLTLPGTPSDNATAESIERARELAEQRDKALAALEARIEQESSALPSVTNPDYKKEEAQRHYEADRLGVDLDYQRKLRHEVPESSPWASILPGMRSGGLEDAANATRRATVDPDPTSVTKTLTSQFALQLDLLRLLIEAPRITSSGPFACPTKTP